MSNRAYYCTAFLCEDEAVWSVTRIGDVVAAWACSGDHLAEVLNDLHQGRPAGQQFTVQRSTWHAST